MLGRGWRIIALRVRDILFVSEWESVELLMSVFLIMWSGWLLLPYATFASMTTYRAINDVVDENVVGAVGVALGALRVYLILNNRYRPRRWLAVASGSWWGYNLALAMLANQSSLLVPIYAAMLLASAWVAFRLTVHIHAA